MQPPNPLPTCAPPPRRLPRSLPFSKTPRGRLAIDDRLRVLMPPKLQQDGHVWADGETGPGPQSMAQVGAESASCRSALASPLCREMARFARRLGAVPALPHRPPPGAFPLPPRCLCVCR